MNEYPIIMSAESVRAIMAGRKTQTRRVIKRNDVIGFTDGNLLLEYPPHFIKCPYGKSGDKLWVKETWWDWGSWIWDHLKRKYVWVSDIGLIDGENDHPEYVADTPNEPDYAYTDDGDGNFWRKRPSIYLPKCYSRITLPNKAVWVERLQDMTEDDAYAEGIFDGDPVGEYAKLWDSINAKRGYSWESNPLVLVIDFGERT